jgi:hypothetical protein
MSPLMREEHHLLWLGLGLGPDLCGVISLQSRADKRFRISMSTVPFILECSELSRGSSS